MPPAAPGTFTDVVFPPETVVDGLELPRVKPKPLDLVALIGGAVLLAVTGLRRPDAFGIVAVCVVTVGMLAVGGRLTPFMGARAGWAVVTNARIATVRTGGGSRYIAESTALQEVALILRIEDAEGTTMLWGSAPVSVSMGVGPGRAGRLTMPPQFVEGLHRVPADLRPLEAALFRVFARPVDVTASEQSFRPSLSPHAQVLLEQTLYPGEQLLWCEEFPLGPPPSAISSAMTRWVGFGLPVLSVVAYLVTHRGGGPMSWGPVLCIVAGLGIATLGLTGRARLRPRRPDACAVRLVTTWRAAVLQRDHEGRVAVSSVPAHRLDPSEDERGIALIGGHVPPEGFPLDFERFDGLRDRAGAIRALQRLRPGSVPLWV